MPTSRPAVLSARGAITPVQYRPAAGHGLDVELYRAAELRRRVLSVEARGVERIDFLCLLYVAAGRYTHMVDFETIECTAGSLVTMQPGQVNRFGNMTGWNGWVLVFRAELLAARNASSPQEDLELFRDAVDLPVHLRVDDAVGRTVTASLERMADDAKLRASMPAVNALLRHQLQALLIRLHIAHASSSRAARVEPVLLLRFRRFRAAVEREHRRWHSVAEYAKHLGCSEKSIGRASLAVTGVGAKAFLTNRIVLEARRLLVHTNAPVATISEQLGFDEATNFVKFFRRETGATPGAFRQGQLADRP
jgi:AraC-like DNA-binding protein